MKQINRVGDKLQMMSISKDELITKPDKSSKIRAMYKTLETKNFIKLIFNSNGEIVYIERLPECLSYKFNSSLSTRDKWIERIIGFISALILAGITWALAKYCS